MQGVGHPEQVPEAGPVGMRAGYSEEKDEEEEEEEEGNDKS